ncbi:MAG TPA: hypothetical protein VHZ76_07480 [Gammaproteobacteria bacterium]|nr:hypothetical protein [Gammaproteobacteria bacterium]
MLPTRHLSTINNPAQNISVNDPISHFKSVLSSHCKELIQAMWDGNQVLHNAIRSLDINQSKLLLKKVISSCKTGKIDFITQYLNGLDDVSVISAVLEDIKTSCRNKNLSAYKINQFLLLQNRFNELTDTSQHNGVTSSHCVVNTNNSNQLTAPAQNTPSKKRKTPSEATSSRKKQSTEKTSSELSHLVNQMPSLLNGKNSFYVEQSLGLDLQKLSKTIKDEMGIFSIRKSRIDTNYKVKISDPSKYSTACQKYAHQPSDEESCGNNLGNSQDENNLAPQQIIVAPNNENDFELANPFEDLLESSQSLLFTQPSELNILPSATPNSSSATSSQTASSPTFFGYQFNAQTTNLLSSNFSKDGNLSPKTARPDIRQSVRVRGERPRISNR